LIRSNKLNPEATADLDEGSGGPDEPARSRPREPVTYFSLLRTLFWLNMSLGLGELLFKAVAASGGKLPLFVCCLFAAILLTNTVPRLLPIGFLAAPRSLAIVSDISLGIFLTMSLMSLQLWTIASLAGPILAILAAQFTIAFLYVLFVVFRAMGSDYEAAVICSGFAGFSLGATPTAMANMSAVAQKYGPARRAFIVVPLVSGFFVDISNAVVIQRFLHWLAYSAAAQKRSVVRIRPAHTPRLACSEAANSRAWDRSELVLRAPRGRLSQKRAGVTESASPIWIR